MRTITVKGTGNVSARPDYIILSLNIETLSKTYDRAMSEATERIERLQGAAVRVGYRKEDLKTTSFDVQTRYENVKDRQGNYKREFAGYACSYRLKLAFDFDSKQLAKVISAIADCGAQPELSIAFTVKNPARVSEELLINATENARAKAEILCKASGSTLGQYSYFISNTGFPAGDRGCLSEPKPSPYPYDEHAMIYYCDDLPHPTREHDAFIEKGVERLLEILSISNGKALVLFTAKTDMEEVYSILSEKNLPYKILMQQPGSSQDKVLNEFKEDTNSVLLGTGAYWEGISIEGKSLSNVIIFRLPFPVPDPIIEYKCSVAKDALMDVRVPEMIIKLKQGIGRLIRNFTDTGIVCIIDRRLRDEPPERYHDITWDSLPIKNRTSSLGELRKFYEGLPSAKE